MAEKIHFQKWRDGNLNALQSKYPAVDIEKMTEEEAFVIGIGEGMETKNNMPVDGPEPMTIEEFREHIAPHSKRYFCKNEKLIDDVRKAAYSYYNRNNYNIDDCYNYRFVDEGRVTGCSKEDAFAIAHEADDMNFKRCIMWAIEDRSDLSTWEKMALMCDVIKDFEPSEWNTGGDDDLAIPPFHPFPEEMPI